MEYLKQFLINTSILITVAYLANLVYKYLLNYTSALTKYASYIVLVIFCGWLTMFFGYNFSETVILDLRFLPLIVAIVSCSEPVALIIIGVGIGLSRFTLGINAAATAGFINLSILGIVAAGLYIWMNRQQFSLRKRGLIAIVVINVVNAINIAIFGVIPFKTYVLEILPITMTLGIAICMIFSLILLDFHQEQLRMVKIKHSNVLLSNQAEELHNAQIVLKERADQLLRSSEYKTEFLANMSHELRTPLNSIINLAEIISERDPHRTLDETVMYGDIIYKSGHDLLRLINDILDLSKVEAGQLEISNEDMNVSEIPELLRLQFDVIAEKQNVQFEIIMDENLPETIFCDPQRVQQILLNLLTNAFKFTNAGKVSLHINKKKELGNSSVLEWMVFSVTDTGIGIAQDKHQAIFEAFQQADGTISRKYGGTGLGLSISRNLAYLLGGFISVESTEREGSNFSLHLPIK